MDRRLFTSFAALGGLAALGLGAGAARPVLAEPLLTVEPDDMVMGSPKAKVMLIEYASASCPHCARFDKEVFPSIKSKYIDTGRVFYVFREFLTYPVQVAAAAFLVARCAGKDKYFSVVDSFFHAQDEIYSTGELRGPLLEVAAAAGLDEKAVDACLADKAAIKALNARIQRYADRDAIRSTPTFFINGQRLEGEQTLAAMDAALAAAESKAKAAPPKPRRAPHG